MKLKDKTNEDIFSDIEFFSKMIRCMMFCVIILFLFYVLFALKMENKTLRLIPSILQWACIVTQIVFIVLQVRHVNELKRRIKEHEKENEDENRNIEE